MKIKIEKLIPNNYNPRELFRGASMEELKASIEQSGLIHPILVRPINNSSYEVVAGMRRYYAMKELGFESIECHVRKLTDFEAILLAYTENIQRENLTPIETGRMYKNLMEKLPSNGTKQFNQIKYTDWEKMKKVAEVMKITPHTIRKYVSLLDLPKALQNLIETDQFPTYYGFELARLTSYLSDLDITKFYDLYYADADTRLSIENFKKEISNRIKQEKEIEKEEEIKNKLRIKKITQEIEQLEQSRESINKQINELKREIEKHFEIEFKEEENLEDFILTKLKEDTETNQYETISKELSDLENKKADLSILLERVKQENIRICPYCLGGIDIHCPKNFFQILIFFLL
ncbi:MAG: ParB/RepB/Spo0J family partition protein [Candidatus Thorarchaeota archaeon]